MTRPLLALLLVTSFAAAAHAQQPGEELTISVITIEAGDAVFEKFAHNALWIHDASDNSDVAYNWGLFDFDQKDFFLNYMLGRLDYWMEAEDFEAMVDWYGRGNNRSTWVSELNLSPAQRLAIADGCRRNALPENRTYRYNYFTDNCSTRVRDAIDGPLGGQIKSQLSPQMTETSFRSHTLRVTRDSVMWYTFFNTALGPATDRRISKWEECFLPRLLHNHLRDVTITDAAGNTVPLVKREYTLYQSDRPPEPAAPPRWAVWYFLAGCLIAAAIERTAWWSQRRRAGRFVFATVASVYLLYLSFFALFALWMWFCSSHWAAWRNENLLTHSPIAVALLLLIPAILRRSHRYTKIAAQLAMALAISTLLALSALLLLPQNIAAPSALALAPNLALAWIFRRHVNHQSPITTP